MSICYETVVRHPDFEEELPPSSLLRAPSQKLPSSSPSLSSSNPPSSSTVWFFSLFFPFPIQQCSAYFSSAQMHISLQHNCNHNLPSNCVQSASNVLQLLKLSSLLFLPQLFFLQNHYFTLTITLKNYFPASLSSCCCYMSFQHICKLYTCWLRLILYMIKQLIDPSINQAIENGDFTIACLKPSFD